MERLRTGFNTVFIGGAALLWLFFSTLVAAPFLWLWRDKTGNRVRKFVFIQSRGIMALVRAASRGMCVSATSRPSGSCVIVANHASAVDLYTVSLFGFRNVVYITKGWVFRLPFFRYVMNEAGYIDAEKTSPQQMLTLCRQAVEHGCDIVFFPQGSRKNPQARFKSGAFYLAGQLNLPVVPIAIVGTQRMLPAGTFRIRPARIVLKEFPAVQPADYPGELGPLHMAQAVKKQIMEFVDKTREQEQE